MRIALPLTLTCAAATLWFGSTFLSPEISGSFLVNGLCLGLSVCPTSDLCLSVCLPGLGLGLGGAGLCGQRQGGQTTGAP